MNNENNVLVKKLNVNKCYFVACDKPTGMFDGPATSENSTSHVCMTVSVWYFNTFFSKISLRIMLNTSCRHVTHRTKICRRKLVFEYR